MHAIFNVNASANTPLFKRVLCAVACMQSSRDTLSISGLFLKENSTGKVVFSGFSEASDNIISMITGLYVAFTTLMVVTLYVYFGQAGGGDKSQLIGT